MFRRYSETKKGGLDRKTIEAMLKWEPLQSVFVPVEELDREDCMEYAWEDSHTSHGTYRRHL